MMRCQCDTESADASSGRTPGASAIQRLADCPHNQGRDRVLQLLQESEREARSKRENEAADHDITLLPAKEVTIHSDEQLKDQAEVEVPLQLKYTGIAPAISSSLAAISCATLGVRGMLDELNDVFRTEYDLDRPGLSAVLQAFLDEGCDFGTAYGRLRIFWFQDLTDLQSTIRALEERHRDEREAALDNETDLITEPLLSPRRIWDLYSNRVVPWWFYPQDDAHWRWFRAGVSHNWLDERARHAVDTPINGHAWPVPVPRDTTLDRVRVELLNYGLEYVWLDVLCLRQMGVPEREALRVEEWKTDVPIIGSIYGMSSICGTIVTYYNGLGRPFRIGDLTSERHWINRAWALQESKSDAVIGGMTDKSPFPPDFDNWAFPDPIDAVKQFYTDLELATSNSFFPANIFAVLAIMQRRAAVHVVDKIAGFTYILGAETLPAYVRSDAPGVGEDAWTRLVESMTARYRGDLLLLYPAAGSTPHTWRPSWQQVVDALPATPGVKIWTPVEYDRPRDEYQCEVHYVAGCLVKGLEEADPAGRCRRGTVEVAHGGASCAFAVVAHHQVPIPEDRYVLVGNLGDQEYFDEAFVYWAVGRVVGDGAFEKVSVVRMESKEDRERLESLGLTEKRPVTLV